MLLKARADFAKIYLDSLKRPIQSLTNINARLPCVFTKSCSQTRNPLPVIFQLSPAPAIMGRRTRSVQLDSEAAPGQRDKR